MLDSVLAILMVAVLVVCWVVYRRLSAIKNGQEELGKLIDNLNLAVKEAQASVQNIKNAAIQTDADLELTIKKSKAMVDELSLMTEVANNLANRLEKNSTNQAQENKHKMPVDDVKEKSKEHNDILSALREAR